MRVDTLKSVNLSENITIRPFNDIDLVGILEVSRKAFTSIYNSFHNILGEEIYKLVYPNWIHSQEEYIKLICSGEDKENIFIIEESTSIIGYISFFMNVEKKSGEIGINAVHPDYQKRGIGQKMYEYVLDIMKDNGIKLVQVSTGGDSSHFAARCAYEKCGFVPLPLVKYYKALNISQMETEAMQRIIAKVKDTLARFDKPILIAIDGRSGTGKSTIAKQLAREFNATIIMGDDFYSGGTDAEWQSRTPQEKVALCIDWKRIRREVLELLLNNRLATYYPFDFKTGHGLSKDIIELKPAKVIILDGAYSARPELHDLIDIKILAELHDGTRRQRLLDREGLSFMENWHSIWDEAEDYYFTQICPPSTFDFVI